MISDSDSQTLIQDEIRRIGLNPGDLAGLAIAGDAIEPFIARLRSLPSGSSWSDVFPGEPPGWRPSDPAPERALGPFDYAEPPRGIAVFASVAADDSERIAETLFAVIDRKGSRYYGRGLVLDKGHPHLYVVLPLEATEDEANDLAEFLRQQPGVHNSYPIVRRSRERDT